MSAPVLEALVARFGDQVITKTSAAYGDPVAYVPRDKVHEVATWLRDDEAMAFDLPVFCTAIDRLDMPPHGPDVPEADLGPRFDVCWQLRSLRHRHTVRLKVELEEQDLKVPTLSTVWPGMNWCERETFDMYGIEFTGHNDLRRIYMYDEFVGYPLRKDYPKEKRQPLVRREWSDEPRAADRDQARKENADG